MSWALVALAVLLAVAAALVAREYEGTLRPRFQMGIRGWRILKLLVLGALAYAFLMSGRTVFQILALLIAIFAGLYYALEWRPERRSRA